VGDADSVAELLRRIRSERGESVREVARRVGVDPSYISRVERGEKVASPAFRQRLAQNYDLPSDDVELASGGVPPDIADILRRHPEVLAELRQRYRPDGQSS
jgi:HTH-type transcriptional regulator, competence development regulator